MDPVLIEGLQTSLVGILVVFLALGLIMVLLMALERARPWLERFEGHLGGEHEAPSVKAPALSDDEVPAEVVAVICAASMEVLGPRVRVRRVRYLTGTAQSGWALQGRVSLMTSHATRR